MLSYVFREIENFWDEATEQNIVLPENNVSNVVRKVNYWGQTAFEVAHTKAHTHGKEDAHFNYEFLEDHTPAPTQAPTKSPTKAPNTTNSSSAGGSG